VWFKTWRWPVSDGLLGLPASSLLPADHQARRCGREAWSVSLKRHRKEEVRALYRRRSPRRNASSLTEYAHFDTPTAMSSRVALGAVCREKPERYGPGDLAPSEEYFGRTERRRRASFAAAQAPQSVFRTQYVPTSWDEKTREDSWQKWPRRNSRPRAPYLPSREWEWEKLLDCCL